MNDTNLMRGTTTSHTIFLQLIATPAWLALSRAERARLIADEVTPLLKRYSGTTRLRWYDAEAYSANPSDLAVVTTSDLTDWQHLFDRLRDTSLWSVPYFTLDRLTVAVEDGFIDYERSRAPRPYSSPR
ncbi:MAG: darcynin family protein [Terriglobales bacterium]